MLYPALRAVAATLNANFRNRFAANKDKVILAQMPRPDDKKPMEDDRIILSLVNVEQERNVKIRQANPAHDPIYLNLYVLFAVYYGSDGSYEQALRELSAIISFFQANPVFTPQNTPELDSSVERMVFRLEDLGFEVLQNMWSMLGAKHTPSVLYKVNMVALTEGNATLGGELIGVGMS